jgi:threonine dehydrogenase-like Zn-dependent dehydrogenase
VRTGDTVAVFGCGPVGQFAITSAKLKGAGRILAVDKYEDRLAMARHQGALVVNFEKEDPIATIKRLTGGIGVDRVIDAVGVDAMHAHHGPAAEQAKQQQSQFAAEQKQVAPEQHPHDGNWMPGDAPGQVLEWAVQAVAKAGTIGIIGVYPPAAHSFPIGQAMNRNLTIKAGNCNHRAHVPHLIELVRSGVVDPTEILTKLEPLTNVIAAYQAFDKREPGWLKTELLPAAAE